VNLDDLMFKPGLMKGHRVLVTGGGTGLGKAMAEALLILGAEVYICGRRGGVLDATVAELTGAHGGKMVGIPCDIRVPEAIHDMLDQIWADGGALTGLINNAAGNFFTTLDCGKRWIAEGKPGSVISILTTWVWSGGPFTVPSAMSKAGLNVMTQSLAVEWGPKNIRFNAIAPGPFYTEGMTARLNPGASADSYRSMRGNPMGRAGDVRELANMAVWLLHPFSAYVNGQTIAIDGGSWNAGGGAFSSLRDWTDEDWAKARSMIQETNQRDRASRTV